MRSKSLTKRWSKPLKLLILALVVQVVSLLLWGLTWPKLPPTVPSFVPKTLSFVVPQEEVEPWQTLAADFEQAHSDIRINLVSDTDTDTDFTTDGRKNIYEADFQSGVAKYDLVYMDIVWPLQFADSLQNLTPYVQRDGLDLSGFLPNEVESGQLDGQLYRLPMRADVGVLYYRQDLLEQAGLSLPRTLAELSQTVDAIGSATGYLWQGNHYEGLIANFVEVMAGMGATWIDADTDQVGLDTSDAIAAAQILRQLIEQEISPNEVITYTEEDALNRFIQGQTVFLRGWPYFWVKLQQSELKGKVAIARPFSFSESPGTGCRGGWGFGIPKNSAHPEEAWEAIKYFTSETGQKGFVLASGFLPSRSDLFEDPEIKAEYPQMPQLLDYLKNSTFRPSIKEYGAASGVLQKALRDILSGQQSAKEAMTTAQAETEKLLKPSVQGG